ncbi:XRE family transcriptional regulator [Listeria ivanovii]|uniref:helix-turn-helix transcriptional regulator n=1 Tax=Listeria ivanovii TaxID=1638 RepID=UPI000DA8D50E|nr:helix-turn-helix transcriptional regulator [Listeria ivanovii]PZG33370.1 XRE family transcriptional regulator [Listeria ivanovii]PZG47123.1 XRE family transcriptional regulator [Listeria ivanovii]PZH11021.1 XRE family transcriptional regulator [Listeria ivanovii]
MRLNEQLEVERKNKGFSKKKLVEIIEETIGLTFQVGTIKRWESGISTIDPKALAFLSELYDISIEDLVSEEVSPIMNNGERYYKFGKTINSFCSVENIGEFISKYEIVQSNDWVVTPKYDLIMRCYEDNLKIEDDSYCNCKAAYDVCKNWMVDKNRSYHEDQFYRRIYDDGAGYLGIKEKRDPVNYLDLLEELEAVVDDIGGYLELFDTGGFNRWEYI